MKLSVIWRKKLSQAGGILLATLVAGQAWAVPIADIEIEAVSPRDKAASPTDIYDEVSSGLHAVGVGQKVYLRGVPRDGATVAGYAWSVSNRPTSSTAALSDTSGEVVTFRPDFVGEYTITLTPLDATMQSTEPVNQTVWAGNYVGAGAFTASATSPECARCHRTSSNARLNTVESWLKTAHANKLQKHLSGELGANYSTSCLACHTLGYDPNSINNGFDDIAASIGYNLANIPALVNDAATGGGDQWANLPPQLQHHASVQCESCHGPGSVHPSNRSKPDKGTSGVNFGEKQCKQCHDSDNGYQQKFYQWENSAHPLSADAAHNASCTKCHTAEGFVAVQVNGAASYTPAPDEHGHGITCSACHDPHGTDYPHELRRMGDTALSSGHVYPNPGMGGLCIGCHNSRVTDALTVATTSYRGSHYGAQGDILLGVNAIDFDLPVSGNSAHTTIVKDTCVTCHMAEPSQSGSGITTPPKVGSHTFVLRDDKGTPDESDDVLNVNNACSECHAELAGATTFEAKKARGDYDGDGVVEGVQSEVKGLFAILRPHILALPGVTDSGHGYVDISQAGFNQLTDAQKKALYNYNLLAKDGSYGIHNTSYTVQMLQRSYWGLTGRSFIDDYPKADLRGPVQPATVAPTPTPIPGPTRTPVPVPQHTAKVLIDIRGASPRLVAADPNDIYDEVASGLYNVGVGEKMYLEGKALATGLQNFTWSITSAPAGSTATLSSTTDPIVTFRPDVLGNYTIRFSAFNPALGFDEVDEQIIHAANYAGVGTLEISGGDNPVAPSCGTRFCHGGSNKYADLNVLDEWQTSNHGNTLQEFLRGESGDHFGSTCLPCHTLGFNTAAVNNGFDDRAASVGFDLNQISTLVAQAAHNPSLDNFASLPKEVKSHSSVQCENCHGAGTLHPSQTKNADRGIAGADLDADQCAVCHDSVSGHQQGFYQWTASAHDTVVASPSTRAECVMCHTGEGFVSVQVKGEEPYVAQFPHAITCSTCHDPHNSDNDHQLRLTGDMTMPSGQQTFGAGDGGLCFRCHNSRVTDPDVTALTSSRGPHYGTQADMLLGVNGSSFGLPFAPNSPHAVVVQDTCVACHMAEPTAAGTGIIEPPKVGSHTFAMRDTLGNDDPSDDVMNAKNACSTCHLGLVNDFALTANGDYDGDGVTEDAQSEVKGLFDLLRPVILSTMSGTSVDAHGRIAITSGGFAALNEIQKKALYNYNFVWSDGSFGVHNTSYAVQLLQRSYFNLTGANPASSNPSMDLVGPVTITVADDKTAVINWDMYQD